MASTLNTDYLLWHTQLIVCAVKSWFKSGVIMFIFQFFAAKIQDQTLFCLIFQFYLIYRLICKKPTHFLTAQMALVSTIFQMFIVLGMYKFGLHLKEVVQLIDIQFGMYLCSTAYRNITSY